MAVRERRVHVLQTAEELKALRSPVRNRLLEVLRRMGEASVGTLAQRLGLKPESLYYHVTLLAKVGLIVLVREQHTGRRPETIYAPVAPNFSINRTNRDPDFLEALLDVYRSQLRLAERELEDA